MFCLLAISAYASRKKSNGFREIGRLTSANRNSTKERGIESMTLNVSQTGKELKVETATETRGATEGETRAANGTRRRRKNRAADSAATERRL